MNPAMNWGYKTTPQEGCGGREIDYSRGKGLGGGSAINFGVFTSGSRDDYDAWGELVSDSETFGWEAMHRRLKGLETFDGTIVDPANQKYARPDPADHGTDGGLKTGFAREWESDVPLILDSLEQAGLERNLDHNSGNPLGMALMINSANKGKRVTGADLLIGAPDNLVVVTDTPVQRVILQDKKAVGVETKEGKCKSFTSLHILVLSH